MDPTPAKCSVCDKIAKVGVVYVQFKIRVENGSAVEGASRYACEECGHAMVNFIAGGFLK